MCLRHSSLGDRCQCFWRKILLDLVLYFPCKSVFDFYEFSNLKNTAPSMFLASGLHKILARCKLMHFSRLLKNEVSALNFD